MSSEKKNSKNKEKPKKEDEKMRKRRMKKHLAKLEELKDFYDPEHIIELRFGHMNKRYLMQRDRLQVLILEMVMQNMRRLDELTAIVQKKKTDIEEIHDILKEGTPL